MALLNVKQYDFYMNENEKTPQVSIKFTTSNKVGQLEAVALFIDEKELNNDSIFMFTNMLFNNVVKERQYSLQSDITLFFNDYKRVKGLNLKSKLRHKTVLSGNQVFVTPYTYMVEFTKKTHDDYFKNLYQLNDIKI